MALTILDAGVIIAILDSNDVHHAAARDAVTQALRRGEELAIPASAYAEVLVGPYRQNSKAAATVDAFLAALPARVEPATREIAAVAAELRARHGARLRLPDALVVATAIELHAASLLTTDAGWPSLPIAVEVVAGSATS
jgi:Predicted nucleic acid-binding protein, contains PIN domain